MKYPITLLLFISCFSLRSQSSLKSQLSTVSGIVVDKDNCEPILFGTVALYKDDVLVTGTETDLDGKFMFINISPGTYNIEVSYVGYVSRKEIVIINNEQINYNLKLTESTVLENCHFGCRRYFPPLIRLDYTSSSRTFNSEQIRRAAY